MVLRYFVAELEPRGQGRPRFRTFPVTQNGKQTMMVQPYKTREDKNYEDAIREAYLRTYRDISPLEGPLAVKIVARMQIPESKPNKTKIRMLDGEIAPVKKPDVDNIAKSVLDACNGVAWQDDKQVCELITEKRYIDRGHCEPGVEVFIRQMDKECGS